MERTSIFSWIFGEWFPDRCSQPALPLPCRWRVRAFPERQSCRPRRAPRSAFLLVLIGLDAANVGFVNLDDAGQLVEFGTARLAQPVQQKPCRLLRDADLFRQLQADHSSNNLANSDLPRGRAVAMPVGRDTEDYVDFVVVDLDAFDEKPDQVALQRPIRSVHALPDLFCEVFEPTDDERQGSA